MKIISFSSGLGNQIFQYYFYLHLKAQYPKDTIWGYYDKQWLKSHDGLIIDKVFKIDLPKSNKLIWFYGTLLRIIYKYLNIGVCKDDYRDIERIMYIGFWQDLKYLSQNNLSFKINTQSLDKNNLHIINSIKKTNSVAIHIRRGDYQLPQYRNIFGNVCSIDYYQNAINIINKKINQPTFFVFSDDIVWVKENIPYLNNAHFIDFNTGKKSYMDMYLMSLCQHNIIANSTFSYFGAYFNKNINKTVIYPSKWIRMNGKKPNIFPNSWIGI